MFLTCDTLTMAGSRSARPHSLGFVPVTLISDPARDHAPLHAVAACHGALRRSTSRRSQRQRTGPNNKQPSGSVSGKNVSLRLLRQAESGKRLLC